MVTSLNEVQLPKELRQVKIAKMFGVSNGRNEVQFPKELQPRQPGPGTRRLCRLNEVQFPKDLRRERHVVHELVGPASMKCSSRRNCNKWKSPRNKSISRPQ